MDRWFHRDNGKEFLTTSLVAVIEFIAVKLKLPRDPLLFCLYSEIHDDNKIIPDLFELFPVSSYVSSCLPRSFGDVIPCIRE